VSNEQIYSFTIDKVKNGVMVRESYNPRSDHVCPTRDTLVFNKREDFDRWLNDIFPKTKGEK
jgi:hypothetical protein